MQQRRVFLISGKQGSGKSTFAMFLRKSVNATVFKFADPLYAMHCACLPILKGYGIRPKEMSKDGELLQVLGTEYGRNKIGQDVWVKACRTRVDHFLEYAPDQYVVIDDCRFENEFDAFPDAYSIRLEAPEEIRKARCSYWREDSNHPSEIGLDSYAAKGKFDCIVNTATLPPGHQIPMLLKAWGIWPDAQ